MCKQLPRLGLCLAGHFVFSVRDSAG